MKKILIFLALLFPVLAGGQVIDLSHPTTFGTITVSGDITADSIAAETVYITRTDANGGLQGIFVNNIFTKVGVVAHKAIRSDLLYTPASAGTACPIAMVGKVSLNGDLTAANAYPGLGWGVQGQIHMVTGSTIDGSTYGSPGAVYAGLRGVVTDAGTSTYTKGNLAGLYSEIQMGQANANDGANFNIYGAWIRNQGVATSTDMAAGLFINTNPSFPNTIQRGIHIAANAADTGIVVETTSTGIALRTNGRGLFGDGTAALPSISFAGDPNTGIYSSGNDSLSLIAGGVEGIRIAEGSGEIRVIVTDTLQITDLATSDVKVLTPTATGGVNVLETSDITEVTLDTLTVEWLVWNKPHSMTSFADSAFVLTMTEDVWAKVRNVAGNLFTVSDADYVTFAGDTATINAGKHGGYNIDVQLSYSGTNTDIYKVALFKNNVLESTPMYRSVATTGRIGQTSISWYNHFEPGDDISIKIMNTANSNDATFISGQWRIEFIHQ